MRSLLSHPDNKNDITFFLKDKILKAFEECATRMITVCGTKAESSNIPNLDIPDHDHEEADSLIAYHCLDASSKHPGCKIDVHSADTDVYLLLLSIAHQK